MVGGGWKQRVMGDGWVLVGGGGWWLVVAGGHHNINRIPTVYNRIPTQYQQNTNTVPT